MGEKWIRQIECASAYLTDLRENTQEGFQNNPPDMSTLNTMIVQLDGVKREADHVLKMLLEKRTVMRDAQTKT